MKYSCVIFDCDGTLVDTLEDIANAANKALAQYGFPAHPVENYRDYIGRGVGNLIRAALPEDARTEERIKEIADNTTRIYLENPLIASKPYPGMAELVAALKSKKVKTAVLSNKPDMVLHRVIEGLFPPLSFDAVQGERPGMGRKPDPALVWELLVAVNRSPRDTILIGDSDVDIQTALNSNCYPLGVSWGFRPRSELEAAGAVRIIDRPEELWELM